jgi:hypothetical protein
MGISNVLIRTNAGCIEDYCNERLLNRDDPKEVRDVFRQVLAHTRAIIAADKAGVPESRVMLELRRRIHSIEKHNQVFDRCESAWCHPSSDNDPSEEAAQLRQKGF